MRSLASRFPRSVPVVTSFAIAVAIGCAFVVLSGGDPLAVYRELFLGSLTGNHLQRSLTRSVPLVGMALVVAIPLRAGIVNLGGDGQMLMGVLAAVLVALYLPVPGVLRIVLAISAGMASGAAYAALAALLQTSLNVPFLISSLLMNYIAIGVTSYLVRFPLRDKASGLPETERVAEEFRLPLSVLGLPISAGLLIMSLVVVLAVINDRRGTAGFDMRMRGINPEFARYSGVNLHRQAVHLAVISGAIAGLVGSIIVLGEQFRFTDGAIIAANYTWSGLLAAILALGGPLGTTFAAMFFAALQVGGFSMERALGVPSVLTQILQALIILCLAMRGGLVRRQ